MSATAARLSCAPESGCEHCGTALSGRQRRWCSEACREWGYANHRWSDAREAAMRAADRLCVRCGDRAEEVDHITPRKGLSLGVWSCLHHQANLRALCHDCHVSRRLWESPQLDLLEGLGA